MLYALGTIIAEIYEIYAEIYAEIYGPVIRNRGPEARAGEGLCRKHKISSFFGMKYMIFCSEFRALS